MFKRKLLSIIVILAITISLSGFMAVPAEACTNTPAYALIAGQYINAGDIFVERTGDNSIRVIVNPKDGWKLVELHIDAAPDLNGLHVNSKGNLVPGQFDFIRTDFTACESNICEINNLDFCVNSCEPFVLAVHAVVEKYDPCSCFYQQETAWGCNGSVCGETIPVYTIGSNWATYIVVNP